MTVYHSVICIAVKNYDKNVCEWPLPAAFKHYFCSSIRESDLLFIWTWESILYFVVNSLHWDALYILYMQPGIFLNVEQCNPLKNNLYHKLNTKRYNSVVLKP